MAMVQGPNTLYNDQYDNQCFPCTLKAFSLSSSEVMLGVGREYVCNKILSISQILS